MRVSEKIWRMFEETPPEDMYIVTPSDMAESDITFVPASKADALSVAPGGPQFDLVYVTASAILVVGFACALMAHWRWKYAALRRK